MRNVGDAQNIIYRDEKANAMIDCGSQLKDNCGLCCRGCCVGEPLSALVLSHFHYDHYSLLLQKCPYWRHLRFENLYIPAVPSQMPASAQPLVTTFLLALQLVTIYKLSKMVRTPFANIFNRCNNITTLSEGDSFTLGNSKLNVLWPPKNITAKWWGQMAKDFVDVGVLYDDIIQQSSDIKEFSGSLSQDVEMLCQKDTLLSYLTDKIENWKQHIVPTIDSSLAEKMENLSVAVGRAANHFSLAFDSEDMLFLGDLEETELNIVCPKKTKSKYNILVAAHHGTHYSTELLNLDVTTAIASVGLKLLNGKTAKIAGKVYKGISQDFKQTAKCGDIYLTF